MSEENKDFDQTQASAVTDSAIRRSLLGSADAVEQAKFEALLMLDDGFERRVHRLELELADEYSFGKLSSEERKLFTTRFLVTPGRVRKLAVSEALSKIISSQSSSHTRVAGQRWNRSFIDFFAFDRPFVSAMLGGVALLIFGTLSWLSLKAPPVQPPAISKRQPPPPSPEKRYAHPVVPQSPGDKSATDSNTEKQQVPTITLQPESKLKHKQTAQLSNPSSEIAKIRVELLVNVNTSTTITYQARLLSADGLQLASFSELRAQPGDQTKVVIDVPAELLKNGSYCVELKQNPTSGNDDLERYCFEARLE